MKVIIPSAKIVPKELQSIGKLPAAIYPVNQKIVFDYIHEQYDPASFVVVAYENADKVVRRLEKYSDTKVIGLSDLRDLAYSVQAGILCSEEACKTVCPPGMGAESEDTIINFGDTIAFDRLSAIDTDCFLYSEDEISDTWTYFEEKNGRLTKIIDKQNLNGDSGRLFCGVFKIKNIKFFSECIRRACAEDDQKNCSNFYKALMYYSNQYPLKPVRAHDWFDIGHIEKYYTSQLEVKAREFNYIQIDKVRGILTKRSDDTEKFIGEIKWYIKLPKDIEYVRPRIFDYSVDYMNPSVSMEYYAYHTIHELFLYGDLTKLQWSDIFRRIRFVINDFQRYTLKDEGIVQSLEDMYLKKTIQRLEMIKEDEHLSAFADKTICVNGMRYQSLECVVGILKDIIPQRLYKIEAFHIIHGDLCFANIMIDSNLNFIKVIDPRGRFGMYDIYGDIRYDLAKLFHSMDGKYDFIIKDLFDVQYDQDSATISYRIKDRIREFDMNQLFQEIFKSEIGNELKNIELIEALLFLSMIPLHKESVEHQMVMLGVGLDILNRVVNITEDNDNV